MTRPLILNHRDVEAFKKRVEKHPILKAKLEDMRLKNIAPGDDPTYVLHLPIGYKVVYTLEQWPKGMARHLSMSMSKPGKLPNVYVVNMVMEALGFRNRIGADEPFELAVKLETEHTPQYVEVLEYLEPITIK